MCLACSWILTKENYRFNKLFHEFGSLKGYIKYMIFLITYDLNRPGQVYSVLEQKIREIVVSGIKPCETVWVVETSSSYSADSIARILNGVTDSTDKLFVVKLANSWQSFGLATAHNQWLVSHLPNLI
jgi:hypothetical protein